MWRPNWKSLCMKTRELGCKFFKEIGWPKNSETNLELPLRTVLTRCEQLVNEDANSLK